jgi:hypothetical protein
VSIKIEKEERKERGQRRERLGLKRRTEGGEKTLRKYKERKER